MKIMVIGNARHGKDSTCNILHDLYRLNFVSSSYFVAEIAVRPYLEQLRTPCIPRGLHYTDLESCYADRINHRSHWFNAIASYNFNDPARLGRELFKKYDIYCGLRRREEFLALRAEKVFDVCFWVDRSKHEKQEERSSNTLDMSVADYIIDNNGTLEDLEVNVMEIMDRAIYDGKIPHITPVF